MPDRLRVLFVIGTLSGGGAERQVLELLRHLDRSRFEPFLYAGSRTGELADAVPADVPVHSFWDEYLKTWRSVWDRAFRRVAIARWRHLADLLEQLRIDVVYDRTFLATIDAAEATQRRPTPRLSACVADPQTELEWHFAGHLERGRDRAKSVYGTADRVLANSQGLKQRLIDVLGLAAERIEIIPNVLDLAQIDTLADEPRPQWRPEQFHLLTVGRIDENKGHRDLLAAIEILIRQRGRTNLVWHIAGIGPGMESLRKQIQSRQLTNVVDFMGFVANPFPCYRAANLVCLPSHSEGLPNVLLESLACRTPVLSTDCPSGPREILNNGRFGSLVPVANPVALANGIEACLIDPTLGRQQAGLGCEFVRQTYDVTVVLPKLERLLVEAAGRRQPQA